MAKRLRSGGRLNNGQSSGPDASDRPDGHAALGRAVQRAETSGTQSSAIRKFEQGMAALQRHDYEAAGGYFQAVVSEFQDERALVERSHVYLALCERELNRRPSAPRTVEERLTAATAALNNGDEEEAERLVRMVLDSSPSHELALYLLAAVEARRGAKDSALDLLTRAFDVSPEIRAQARHDLDFETLRDLEGFQQLLEAPVTRGGQNSAAPRRSRRPRAGG
jgi:Tfp pilus assembly protein PilF